MLNFQNIILNKCLQICVMFSPILLWNLYFLIQLGFSLPNGIFGAMRNLCIFLIVFSVVFGNSFVCVYYEEKEERIAFYFRKVSSFLLIKNILSAFPILLFLSIYATIPLFVYGFVQLIYMYYNKNHFTMCEQISYTCMQQIRKRRVEKERNLA